MKRLSLFYLLILSLIMSHCSPRPAESVKQTVSVSILPLKYLVDSIAGGDFEALVIMPPGSNPETYEPQLPQMKEVARAKANFQIGLIDFEKSFGNSLKTNALDARFINLSEGMHLLSGSPAEDAEMPHLHMGLDPHVWLSPTRVRAMAQKIADTLIEIQPDSAGKYKANRDRLISTIDSVDRYITRSFSELTDYPFLIFHPSLTYYAADYGLRQIPIEQEGKEPSVAHMKALIQSTIGQNIHTVIYPAAQNRHTVEALIQEAGLQAVPFDPVAYDWPVNMVFITDQIKQSISE